MEIIRVTNLKKQYGEVLAVDGISFCVREGEVFGFLGPNGAGKTSTINMMIGLSRPSGGQIVIDGIDAVKDVKKVQKIIGVVPDENNMYGEMDGFENLCFCAALYGMRKAEREKRAKELLEHFNLAVAGKRPFRAYSKGMKRKLTIAAGIIHDPKILFLDEPTTGIDVESARQIRELILGLKEQGKTIFITTHYIEEAQRVCDRIAFIVKGRIVKIGTVSDLLNDAVRGHKLSLKVSGSLNAIRGELETRFQNFRLEFSDENSLLITSKEPVALYPVIQWLDSKGISVYEAREIKPTLEDVFVKITAEKAKVEV
jgi:ABC-2 type transport system ATP-binding protein